MKFKQLCTASVRWPNVIPLRGLTRPRRIPGETSIVPTWAAIGPASSSIAAGSPHRAKKVRRVLDVLHPGIEKWAHSRGLIPCLPRLFGGFGLPGRTLTLKDVPRWVRICLRGVLYRSSVQDIMSFGRPWSASKPVPFRQMAADHARERLARGKVAFSRREKRVPSGFLPLGSARDAEEIITLSVSRQLALMMGYADEPRKKLKGFFPAPGQVGMKARKNLLRYF